MDRNSSAVTFPIEPEISIRKPLGGSKASRYCLSVAVHTAPPADDSRETREKMEEDMNVCDAAQAKLRQIAPLASLRAELTAFAKHTQSNAVENQTIVSQPCISSENGG